LNAVKCQSCGEQVDTLIPIFVLEEVENSEVFILRFYCSDCFYIRTDPIQVPTKHLLVKEASKILGKASKQMEF